MAAHESPYTSFISLGWVLFTFKGCSGSAQFFDFTRFKNQNYYCYTCTKQLKKYGVNPNLVRPWNLE